jgi:DNA-binding response OmpR family regulator
LISENDPDYQFLYKVAISEINPDIEINLVFAGEQVLQYLLKDKLARELNRQILPNLIIASYDEKHFSEKVLSDIRAYERFYTIPVYVLRSDFSESKREALRLAGANDVFQKPETFLELKERLSKLVLSHTPKKLTKGLFCSRCEEVMEFDPEWGPLAGQIKLTEQEREFVKDRFAGALCIPCLRQLKTSYKIISGKYGTDVNSIINKN